MADLAQILGNLGKEAKKHIKEIYSTLDKGSTGKNIRHDASALASNLKTALPMLAKDPQHVTMGDMLNSGVGVMPLSVKGLSKLPETEFSRAHTLAQANAALPVEQGGLGLHPDNTAMDRARAMGFETAPKKEMYHSSRKEWANNEIDPAVSDLGFHIGSLEQAENRARAFATNGTEFDTGANIIPLMKSKYTDALPIKDEGSFHADSIAPQFEKNKLLSKGYTKKILADPLGDSNPREWDKVYDAKMRDILSQNGYDGVKYSNAQEGDGISYAITNPSVVRSRFAAFDPLKKNSANILASGLLGTALLQHKKKKSND
jgi:hypothetical protein